MIYLLTVIVVILCFLLLCQYLRVKKIHSDLKYLKQKIDLLRIKDENDFILLSSDEKTIQELSNSINKLLESYYRQSIEQHKTKQNMQQMVTNISHDLKTPITVISGYIEYLLMHTEEFKLNEQVISILEKVSIKSNRLTDSMNQIFLLAKIHSNDIVPANDAVNINQLCKEIILDYYDRLEELNVEVELEIPKEDIILSVNNLALERVLKNLIENAIRYGMEGKYLGFGLKNKTYEIEFFVTDHGAGIQPENQKKIFERKYTENRNKAGSGLGLAIVINLVEEMHGELTLDSTPHERTTFSVILQKC